VGVFGKHQAFVVKEANPLNGGAPAQRLVAGALTPVDHFFVRNHGSIPRIDAAAHRLSVTGMVQRPLTLSLPDLRRQFPTVTVEAVLECAGNRRSELMALRPVPGELPWDAEAVGNAEWTGVPLAAVLAAAGVVPGALHAAFNGGDEVTKDGRRFGFGGSIPLAKATAPEVLLAFDMNGEPLRLEHGAPLRVVVPGYIGARSVKWVDEIVVSDRPSENYFQTKAYKMFPPAVTAATVDWASGKMLGEIPVNAAIADPADHAVVPAGRCVVRGYALSGAAPIVTVEVSADGGRRWQPASLQPRSSPWAWCLWDAALDLAPGAYELTVRARDARGATQPDDMAEAWNFKGYLNNARHRVRITVQS
jgi:sulfite oxidase